MRWSFASSRSEACILLDQVLNLAHIHRVFNHLSALNNVTLSHGGFPVEFKKVLDENDVYYRFVSYILNLSYSNSSKNILNYHGINMLFVIVIMFGIRGELCFLQIYLICMLSILLW